MNEVYITQCKTEYCNVNELIYPFLHSFYIVNIPSLNQDGNQMRGAQTILTQTLVRKLEKMLNGKTLR